MLPQHDEVAPAYIPSESKAFKLLSDLVHSVEVSLNAALTVSLPSSSTKTLLSLWDNISFAG